MRTTKWNLKMNCLPKCQIDIDTNEKHLLILIAWIGSGHTFCVAARKTASENFSGKKYVQKSCMVSFIQNELSKKLG